MWWRRPPQRTLLVRTDWWPELEQYTLWTYWVLPFCSSVRSPPHSTYSWTQSVRNNQTVRHTVKQRYLIRQTVRHSETVGHSHTQPDIVRHTQTVRHRETVGHSQIHSNTVRKTQHTKHTQKKRKHKAVVWPALSQMGSRSTAACSSVQDRWVDWAHPSSPGWRWETEPGPRGTPPCWEPGLWKHRNTTSLRLFRLLIQRVLT